MQPLTRCANASRCVLLGSTASSAPNFPSNCGDIFNKLLLLHLVASLSSKASQGFLNLPLTSPIPRDNAMKGLSKRLSITFITYNKPKFFVGTLYLDMIESCPPPQVFLQCHPFPEPGLTTVGVQGDRRTHPHVAALRAITSEDGMTADWYQFDPKFLDAGRKVLH
eukprot:Gb_18617 [translate_table: standard]